MLLDHEKVSFGVLVSPFGKGLPFSSRVPFAKPWSSVKCLSRAELILDFKGAVFTLELLFEDALVFETLLEELLTTFELLFLLTDCCEFAFVSFD
ncbi:hypothetical protein LGAA44_100020 [Leuconostoc gasicomitatum]|nr:hypothetical protein LGAA44_100020 [Leuconostoc gasicomitatum]